MPEGLRLIVLASSLDTTSLDELEVRAGSVTRDQIRTWLSRFDGTEEVSVLSTCHRVELVLLVRSGREVDRWLKVLPGTPTSWQVWEGGDAIHHLFRVAAGRESLALGEVEVRHQVRAAGRAVESRHPRPVLAGLFSAAVDAAEEISLSSRRTLSVAAVGATALLQLVRRPFPRVMIVGAGMVGRQVAERLSSSAQVTVLYYQRPPGSEFVRATGVQPLPYDRLPDELRSSDAVVTALKSGVPCLRASQLPHDRPLVLVDLGVPRNIDPDVRELPNVRLVDLEELHSMSRPPPPAGDEDTQVEVLARRFSTEFQGRLLEPWVDALLRAAEHVRQSELANSRPFLGTLTREQEIAIDRLTRHLVTRLLVPPAQRLRSLPTGPEGDRQRRFAFDLLGPCLDDP